MSYIAINYYKRMKKGNITNINDVPGPWRKEARELLEADNYIINDDGTFTDMNP